MVHRKTIHSRFQKYYELRTANPAVNGICKGSSFYFRKKGLIVRFSYKLNKHRVALESSHTHAEDLDKGRASSYVYSYT